MQTERNLEMSCRIRTDHRIVHTSSTVVSVLDTSSANVPSEQLILSSLTEILMSLFYKHNLAGVQKIMQKVLSCKMIFLASLYLLFLNCFSWFVPLYLMIGSSWLALQDPFFMICFSWSLLLDPLLLICSLIFIIIPPDLCALIRSSWSIACN